MGRAGLDYLWNATSTHTFNLPSLHAVWNLPLICLTNLQHSLGNTCKVLNVMSRSVDYLTISLNICVWRKYPQPQFRNNQNYSGQI